MLTLKTEHHSNVLSSVAKESTHVSSTLIVMKIVLNGSRVARMHSLSLLCVGVFLLLLVFVYGENYFRDLLLSRCVRSMSESEEAVPLHFKVHKTQAGNLQPEVFLLLEF